jgi:lipoprotein-anchoring transpeptidase ErfK/SrfK
MLLLAMAAAGSGRADQALPAPPAPQAPAPPAPAPSPANPTVPAPAAAAPEAPQAAWTPESATLAAQVWLDRLGFSPGEIDGAVGPNLKRTIASFQRARNLPITEQPDTVTLSVLSQQAQAPIFAIYRLAPEDLAGPFTVIPRKLNQQSALPALGYTSPTEALAERFHVSPKILLKLNPGAKLVAGQALRVPNVLPPPALGEKAPVPAARIVVSKASSTLEAFGPDGALVFRAPVSSGSDHDPLPIGSWKVKGVAKNPVFHYNPKLFWDADSKDVKSTVPAGPNNPVGVVWVDLDKDHYGLHGTPEPSHVGHTESHGCVRLTNWDAQRVAALVVPGTPVVFEP